MVRESSRPLVHRRDHGAADFQGAFIELRLDVQALLGEGLVDRLVGLVLSVVDPP